MSKLTLAIGAIAAMLVSVPASAGPCLNDISQAVEDTQRALDAVAAKGKAGTESTTATMHRQPTQMTVAGAEEQLGEISEAKVNAVHAFIQEARKADAANDKAACEKALEDARKAARDVGGHSSN